MKVYCITPEGYFTGETAIATPSPFRAGDYLIPALTVQPAPPPAKAGEIQRWLGEQWHIEKVDAPVQPEPKPVPEQKPQSLQQQKAAFLLPLADEHIAAARADGLGIPEEWIAYREQLAKIAADDSGTIRAIPVPPTPIRPPAEEPEPPPEPPLDHIKASASSQIAYMLDLLAEGITGPAPLAEKLSWEPKQQAARAWLAGEANEEQLAMLQAEASVTGETLDELAAAILTNAANYFAATGLIAGLRRTLLAAVSASKTIAEVNQALSDAEAKIKTHQPDS